MREVIRNLPYPNNTSLLESPLTRQLVAVTSRIESGTTRSKETHGRKALFTIEDSSKPFIEKHIALLQQVAQQHNGFIPFGNERYELTPNLHELLYYVVAGDTNKEIACKLGLAESTIKHYLTPLNETLGTPSREETAKKAIEAGLVEPSLITSQADLDAYSSLSDKDKTLYDVMTSETGYTNKEIAYELGLSESTIKNRLSPIMEMLGIDSRQEFVMYDVSRRRRIAERADEGLLVPSLEGSRMVDQLWQIDNLRHARNTEIYDWFHATSYIEAMVHAAFYGYFPPSLLASSESFAAVDTLTRKEKILLHRYGLYSDTLNHEDRLGQMHAKDSKRVHRKLQEIQEKTGCKSILQAAGALLFTELETDRQRLEESKEVIAQLAHLSSQEVALDQSKDQLYKPAEAQLSITDTARELIDIHAADYSSQHHNPRLTPSEIRVLYYVTAAYNNEQIATLLKNSPKTIDYHFTNILNKLDAKTREDAVAKAIGHSIVNPFLIDSKFDPQAYIYLTPAEQRVYGVITNFSEKGLSNNDIGEILYQSRDTVRRHITAISEKLGLKSIDQSHRKPALMLYEINRQQHFIKRRHEAYSPPAQADGKVVALIESGSRMLRAHKELYQWFDASSYAEAMAHAAFYGYIPLAASEISIQAVTTLTEDERELLQTYTAPANLNSLVQPTFVTGYEQVEQKKLLNIQKKLGCDNIEQVNIVFIYTRLMQYEQQLREWEEHKMQLEKQNKPQESVIFQAPTTQ